MQTKYRVLIIEDNPDLVDSYKITFRKLTDVRFEYAKNKIEATEKISEITFHSAIVDIMLSENHTNTDGLDILKYFQELDEGTRCIVASGYDKANVPVKALTKLGAVDYIIKDEKLSPSEWRFKLEDNIRKAEIKVYGRFKQLLPYLATPEETYIWEDVAQRSLNVSTTVMQDGLHRILEKFLPILKPSDLSKTISIDSKALSISALFWSKSLGCPIWISIANSKNGKLVDPISDLRPSETLFEFQKNKLIGKVWRVTSPHRKEFLNLCDDLVSK